MQHVDVTKKSEVAALVEKGPALAVENEPADPAAAALAERQRKADALVAEGEAERLKEAAKVAMAAERERRMLAAVKPQTVTLGDGSTITMPVLTMGAFLDLLPDLETAMKIPEGEVAFGSLGGEARHAYGFARCIEALLGVPDGWSRTIGVCDYLHLFDAFTKAAPLEAWHSFFDRTIGRIWGLEPEAPPETPRQ